MKVRLRDILIFLISCQFVFAGNVTDRLNLDQYLSCRGALLPKGYKTTAFSREAREAVTATGEKVRVRYLPENEERRAHIRVLQRLLPLMRGPRNSGFRLAEIREMPGSDYLEWPVEPGIAAWENLELYRDNLRKFAALLMANFTTVQSTVERDVLAWTIRLFDQKTEEFLGQLIVTPNANHVVYNPVTGSMILILDVTSYSEDVDR